MTGTSKIISGEYTYVYTVTQATEMHARNFSVHLFVVRIRDS